MELCSLDNLWPMKKDKPWYKEDHKQQEFLYRVIITLKVQVVNQTWMVKII